MLVNRREVLVGIEAERQGKRFLRVIIQVRENGNLDQGVNDVRTSWIMDIN